MGQLVSPSSDVREDAAAATVSDEIGHIHLRADLTAEHKELVLDLAYVGGEQRLTGYEFLALVDETDGPGLALSLLEEALRNRSGSDMERAAILMFEFGVLDASLPLLIEIAGADWHHSHNDVVTLLEDATSPQVVRVLQQIAEHQPNSLDEIDAQTLANNAVWAIFKSGSPMTGKALEQFRNLPNEETRLLVEQMLREL